MKLSDWASIAEIASGIAVVVTLIILIVGVNENTDVTRALVYDSSIGRINETRNNIVRDPEIARLVALFLDRDAEGFETLDRAEVLRLSTQLQMAFGAYETAYLAREYGVMGESEWARFISGACRQVTRLEDFPELWRPIRATLTDEFRGELETVCRNENDTVSD